MAEFTRRRFLKGTLIMGTAVTACPTLLIPRVRADWAKRTPLHPQIDDLRVVGVTDKGMARAEEPATSWRRQNELVEKEVVWANIDRLACSLAQTGHSTEAWRAIFVKPPKKSWSDTVVAVKTNNIGMQHTRSAVMTKICHVLLDSLGVKPSNVHIYDACHGRNMSRDTPFEGLPEGCRIEGTWGGSRTATRVPAPWKDGKRKAQCLKHVVDGTVDILINIAMCKGHSNRFGGFTMAMKNHFGTFSPKPGHKKSSFEYLLAINRTPEILGPMDKRTGRVLYPRQQLCLVDALWASEGGPGGRPSHQPNFLAMGVSAPLVDYLVATDFRRRTMGWKIDMKALREMLASFGYHQGNLSNGGRIIEA